MSCQLRISFGQCSEKGRKNINQDFHGVYIPQEPQLSSKGIAIALADGISSSDVSQIASETAVKSFLEDYYCTSDAWTVRKSGLRVLVATNSWLHSQLQKSQYPKDKDRGYVCTFSALVIKSTTAHIFHLGDTRIYRLRNNTLEQLTNDHEMWVSQDKSYLGRAMGIDSHLEVDYISLQTDESDIFFLATDGVYEFITPDTIIEAISDHRTDLGAAAKRVIDKAYEQGSTDNLTAQIIYVDALPDPDASEIHHQVTELPLPPILEARTQFDGYNIIRELHASSRSHVYLAEDCNSGATVVIKTPSIDLQNNAEYLERFLMEEWIARRINSPYILKPCLQTRKHNYLYIVTEYIEGITLAQWMIDNPMPDIEKVRNIIEQIARGLRAFHRLEMLHQDLRPANIMLDNTGTVKIIDFGSTSVAGIEEVSITKSKNNLLGTAQYSAPEIFLGESGSSRSDLFSLAVICYQMLTGRLPYGTQVAKSRTKAAQHKLKYNSSLNADREIPTWVDDTLRKAVHPDPGRRYGELSEFLYDLRHPNQAFMKDARPPLAERNPVAFWKTVSIILTVIVVAMSIKLWSMSS